MGQVVNLRRNAIPPGPGVGDARKRRDDIPPQVGNLPHNAILLRMRRCLFFFVSTILPAQTFDSQLYSGLEWRMIGPFRGGRTVGAAGIPAQPNVFFIGVNNGGVWKTDDYGRTWNPIFDDQPTGSIGAIAVAPSNPSILYVGSGEGLQRPDLAPLERGVELGVEILGESDGKEAGE